MSTITIGPVSESTRVDSDLYQTAAWVEALAIRLRDAKSSAEVVRVLAEASQDPGWAELPKTITALATRLEAMTKSGRLVAASRAVLARAGELEPAMSSGNASAATIAEYNALAATAGILATRAALSSTGAAVLEVAAEVFGKVIEFGAAALPLVADALDRFRKS